ncbi:unnamed protein product, partial [Laminaria digitata]
AGARLTKEPPRHSCRSRGVRGPRNHMQSHACRPRSQLRTWERCVADHPGLAGGVCAPACSDHSIEADCAAAAAAAAAACCSPRNEQPENLAMEEARAEETCSDAWTSARRTAAPELEPEPEAGPEAEEEEEKEESPSSGSRSGYGSCNGIDSRSESARSCTSKTVPINFAQARGGEANGGHGRLLETRSVDCTHANVKTEEGWEERLPNLEGGSPRGPSGFSAPHHDRPGGGEGAGAGVRMETGATLEPSMSASTESEAAMTTATTTTTTMALADEGAAAVVSSKTSQSEAGSNSVLPTTSAVEAGRGSEIDSYLEARALEGAAGACGRLEVGD